MSWIGKDHLNKLDDQSPIFLHFTQERLHNCVVSALQRHREEKKYCSS